MSATTGPLSGFGSGARHGRWANIGRAFLCMQFASGVRDSVDSLASSLDTVLDQQVAGSLARLNFRLLMLILFPRRGEPRHFGVADVQSRYVTCK